MVCTYEQQVVPHEVDAVAFSQGGIELYTGAGRDHTLFLVRLPAAGPLQHGECAATGLHTTHTHTHTDRTTHRKRKRMESRPLSLASTLTKHPVCSWEPGYLFLGTWFSGAGILSRGRVNLGQGQVNMPDYPRTGTGS